MAHICEKSMGWVWLQLWVCSYLGVAFRTLVLGPDSTWGPAVVHTQWQRSSLPNSSRQVLSFPLLKWIMCTSYSSLCSPLPSHLFLSSLFTLYLSIGDHIYTHNFSHHVHTHDSQVYVWSSCSVTESQTQMLNCLLEIVPGYPRST